MFSKEKTLFVTKVTLAHVFTYFLCGFIFMNLLDYSEFIEALGFKNMDEISGFTVILGQIVRGVLFGIVVWLIKDSIIGKRLAWLKLWTILVIVGIISVYAPASGSIEGLIYLAPIDDLPPTSALSIFEVMAQPLLFSIIVTFQRKSNKTA
jgi:hypothetical protein